MKININNGLINQADFEKKSQFTNKSGVTAAGAINNTDRTTLSSTTLPTVSSLVSRAMQTPSVRQDKVNALKDAVSSGSYLVDSTKLAGAIADEAGS